MQLLGHLIVRLIVVLFGYILAIIAAAMFLSLGMVRDVVGPAIEYYAGVEAQGFLVPLIGLISSPFLAGTLLGPAAIVIAIAEWMRWNGLITNTLLGAALSLFAGWLHLGNGEPGTISQGALVVLAATGFIAGFVYWVAAGRSAGKWLDTDLNPVR